MTSASRSVFVFAMLAAVAQDVAAHPIQFHTGGFAAGLAHPFLGLDHVLASVAIGVWAVQCGPRSRLVLPFAFIVAIAAATLLARTGVAVPHLEAGVAATVLAIGLLITLAIRLPLYAGTSLASSFALWHGYAHGSELAVTGAPWSWLAGLLIATTILVVGGVLAGRWSASRLVGTRVLGACVAIAGVGLIAAA